MAEILPIDSADMCWGIDDDTMQYNDKPYLNPYKDYTAKEYYIPCWSLAALLNVIPDVSLNAFKDKKWYAMIIHNDKMIYGEKDNPIDACYEMILKLHEEKLL